MSIVSIRFRRSVAATGLLLASIVVFGCGPQEQNDRLAVAVEKKDEREAIAALAAGADPRATNADGVPALWIAAANGQVALVAALLQSGAKTNQRMTGIPLLVWLASKGSSCSEPVVRLLLENGAEIGAKEPLSGESPLMVALAFGADGCAGVLLDSGADSAEVDRREEGSIFAAVVGGSSKLLARLISEGVSVDRPNVQGVTPLMAAAAAGNSNFIIQLLNAGADPCKRDSRNRTPLDLLGESALAKSVEKQLRIRLTCFSPAIAPAISQVNGSQHRIVADYCVAVDVSGDSIKVFANDLEDFMTSLGYTSTSTPSLTSYRRAESDPLVDATRMGRFGTVVASYSPPTVTTTEIRVKLGEFLETRVAAKYRFRGCEQIPGFKRPSLIF